MFGELWHDVAARTSTPIVQVLDMAYSRVKKIFGQSGAFALIPCKNNEFFTRILIQSVNDDLDFGLISYVMMTNGKSMPKPEIDL